MIDKVILQYNYIKIEKLSETKDVTNNKISVPNMDTLRKMHFFFTSVYTS